MDAFCDVIGEVMAAFAVATSKRKRYKLYYCPQSRRTGLKGGVSLRGQCGRK